MCVDLPVPDGAAKWRLEFFGDQGRLCGDGVIGQVDGGALDALFLGEQGGYDAQQDAKRVEGEQIDVEFGDEFLTLTTCNYARRKDGRFVLVCRRIREGETIE